MIYLPKRRTASYRNIRAGTLKPFDTIKDCGLKKIRDFNPTDIGGLQLYLDASLITGLSDGDTVTTWSDFSSKRNDATQGTVSRRPIWKINYCLFDGIDDFMNIASFTPAETGITVAASVVFGALANYPIVFSLGDGQEEMRLEMDTSTFVAANSAGIISPGATISLGTRQTIILIDDGATLEGFLDNTSAGTRVSTTLPGAFAATIGARSGPSFPFSGRIYKIVIYNRVITLSERANVQSWLIK